MNEFETLVFNMRAAQRNYFKTRSKYWLTNSKVLESEVDKHLDKINNPEIQF